jgi:uncharacterized protein (TIGR02217 family)
MGYINQLLDEEVAYGFEGGPEYNTTIVDLDNSLEQRDSKWIYPRHKYSASFDNMDDAPKEAVIEIFHAVRGRRHAFKFKDWNDYVVVDEPVLVAAGTMNPIQLYKTYAFGEAFTIRPIQAVSEDTVVKDNVGATVAGTLNTELGMFTPAANWAATPYTWTGEFYVWVRFQDDYNAFTINSWRASTSNVELQEDKRRITATNVPDSWEE